MTDTSKSPLPTQEQIRLRAYEIYVARGGEDGQDLSGWIAAERELSGSSEQKATGRETSRSAVAGQRG